MSDTSLINDGLEIYLSWPPANKVDPYTRTWLLPVSVTLWSLGTLCIILRMYLRARGMAGRFGLDDALILFGWAFGTALTFLMTYGAQVYDLGRHAWDVPLENWTHIAYYYFLVEPLFIWSGCFIKVSVLLFYRRLSENATSLAWKYALLGCIAFTVIWSLGLFITQLLTCHPVDAFWLQFDLQWIVNHSGQYSCVHTNVTTLLAGILACISDAYSTLLPCILVRNLQMARRTKIGLNIIFCLGLAVTMISVVRTVYFMRAANESDVSWNIYWAILFLELETHIGIVCACLPSLKVFFRKYLKEPMDKVLTTARAGRSKGNKLDSNATDSTGSRSTHERKASFAVERIHNLDVELAEDDNLTPVSPLIREHGEPELIQMTPQTRYHSNLAPQSSTEKHTPYSPI